VKLYGSLTSPFVRAVRIAAIELGLDDQIAFVPTLVRPTEPNRAFGDRVNPLRRVPALETDDGLVLLDSRVIIEFLNKAAKGAIVPKGAGPRIACFNRHAVVAGATEALVLAMYESRLRPCDLRWRQWSADQTDKAGAALDWVEARIDDFADGFDLAGIALVCLVGYAQFRFGDVDWLAARPAVARFCAAARERRSVAATEPRE
jgi:glutathione S-transferase